MKKIGKIGSNKIIEVRTAHEINDESLLKRIEKRLGNEYEVRMILDPSIKGGIIVKDIPQNKLFDASVSDQLKQLKQQILN
ncbi:F0F1 ATP synthase subunit delta [Candidatus Dojkabacteria bacterium]|uniref:F0F1 ATP synthase subunit delta n=1 Tax=Candidatus Dojkabacteria bacterium TaxID=2099670 RepID=A0A955LAV2_9BACT|nr:F0F1 ATP synthase subunit delta [Candidatus Dojkabacteria bacterium]